LIFKYTLIIFTSSNNYFRIIMASTNMFTVADALANLKVTDQSLKELGTDNDLWGMFGKKDSHLLRAKLFKILKVKKMTPEATFMVFFFHAVIKNRDRILQAFDTLPDNIKSIPSVVSAKEFINSSIVQYTDQESATKFASVHLPTTMPGADLMMTALIIDDNNESLESTIFTKQTFSQINISPSLQEVNKSAQRMFWDNVVKTSKNEARRTRKVTEELKFHEEYYNTSAADKYLLVDLEMNEVKPANVMNGYTKEEVVTWFKKVKSDQANKMRNISSTSATAPAST
jgi:hypothetical protein